MLLDWFFPTSALDGVLRDLTARYARQWMSHTRKLRVAEEWWQETLAPFDTTSLVEKRMEDDEVKGQLKTTDSFTLNSRTKMSVLLL